MRKGQMVKCVRSYQNYITEGMKYIVIAGRGDECQHLGGVIDTDGGMNIIDDDGDLIYVSVRGVAGEFVVVSDDA